MVDIADIEDDLFGDSNEVFASTSAAAPPPPSVSLTPALRT